MAHLLRPVAFGVGRALRETGQAIDRVGSSMMGNYAFKEQLSRHRRIMPLGELRPTVGLDTFVAPNASVIGNVTLADRTSVWYGAVLRADRAPLHIGEHSSIGDRAVIVSAHDGHTPTAAAHNNNDSSKSSAEGVRIGARVSVGAGVAMHGRITIADQCVIGAHAVLVGPVTLGSGAVVAPGAVVPSGSVVGAHEVWSGSPARFERNLSAAESESVARLAADSGALARVHAAEHAKDEAARQRKRDFKEFHKTPESLYKETPF